MKARGLTGLYDRLSAEERLRLTLAALSRDDDEELRRLEQTCPRHTYLMADCAVADLVHASREAALFFTIIFQCVLRLVEASLFELRAVDSFVDGCSHGMNLALAVTTQTALNPDEGDDVEEDEALPRGKLRESLLQDRVKSVAALKGLYAGFQRFCRDAALEPSEVLAWSPIGLLELESARTHIDQRVAADEYWAEETRKAFREYWPELARQVAGGEP